MLLKARLENDKIIATHVVRVDQFREFAAKMRKEKDNGWSKMRLQRWCARIPESAIEKYEEKCPGFKDLAFGKVKDWKLRDKVIREFLRWSENRDFAWGNV
jgi:hypothetical protein